MKPAFMRSVNRLSDRPRLSPVVLLMFAAVLWTTHYVPAQTMKAPGLTVLPQNYEPYSGHFLGGGIGLTKPLPAADPVLKANVAWTLSAWVEFSSAPTGAMLIAGVGDPRDQDSRFFAVENGLPELRVGRGHFLRSTSPLDPSAWHLLTATSANITESTAASR
ncbi:MAG: hypothetical protein WCE63_02335 [Acidobacteriaceae bacterium]